ncbi:hypothetical protein ACFOLG_08955 [Vogesella facilis]|uniref:HNH endonuclease n=1 Tax=Vogesella facilis TaxID=1655232 RepID=A0ABV7RES8_9NEIS
MTFTNLSNNQSVYDCLINGQKLPQTCLLCSEGELHKLGHIIPKFVMRWLKFASKKSSFYLNNTETEVSDTLAIRILCDKCEDIFSRHEKAFVDNYFKKYYRKTNPGVISEDIYYFSLSVAWRIMISTPMMRGEEIGDTYYRKLRDIVGSYLIQPNKSIEVDVYVFLADEIAANLPIKSCRTNLLNFSIRQGIFVQNLMYNDYFRATVAPIPLVHFKLGAYYFIVACQDYLQRLSFHKIIDSSKESKVHLLRYSDDLVGFLNHISNGGFLEVIESAIPRDSKYDRIA